MFCFFCYPKEVTWFLVIQEQNYFKIIRARSSVNPLSVLAIA